MVSLFFPIWRMALRWQNLTKGAIKCLFAFINAKLTSGFHKPLVLTLVSYLWGPLLLFACFSHTASQ